MKRWIMNHNIARYEALLQQPQPPEQEKVLHKLLAEERRKLASLEAVTDEDA